MAKKFDRVAAVPKQIVVPQTSAEIVPLPTQQVVNLERIDLADRENWLRALDICKVGKEQSLNTLLEEISTYQGQIDRALQTAQAQSTIYAYAIGTRLDAIEANQLYEDKGYINLTAFIKAGEIKRPSGQSITTRQVWAYRSVTRGLSEFLQLAENIRDGQQISSEMEAQLSVLGSKVNQDIVDAFLSSYAESITGVLELGVSKLEQMYRLPRPVAMSSLLAGKLALEEEVIEVHDVPFSALRKAISTHEKKKKPKSKTSRQVNIDGTLDHLRDCLKALEGKSLNERQQQRLRSLSDVMIKMLD